MIAIAFILKLIFGLVTGLFLVLAFIWTVFVYPYSDVSLAPFWWGLGIGIGITTAILYAWGYYLGNMS